MRKALCVAGALVLLPSIGHAQEFAPLPGFYIGAGAGGAWYLPSSTTIGGTFSGTTGMLADLLAGLEFFSPPGPHRTRLCFLTFTPTPPHTPGPTDFTCLPPQIQA